jgi:hypothetical protein
MVPIFLRLGASIYFFRIIGDEKKILSIGLNYFTQIIFPPPEGDEGGGLSLLFFAGLREPQSPQKK